MGICISKKVKITPKKKYKKKSIPKPLKKLVWDTYIGESVGIAPCFCCKHQQIRQIEFHCGHVLSEIDGGKLEIDNLRPICAQCNLSMGKMDMMVYQRLYFQN
jgi:5-methylcytosine-specific restriction endonuclease McrA